MDIFQTWSYSGVELLFQNNNKITQIVVAILVQKQLRKCWYKYFYFNIVMCRTLLIIYPHMFHRQTIFYLMYISLYYYGEKYVNPVQCAGKFKRIYSTVTFLIFVQIEGQISRTEDSSTHFLTIYQWRRGYPYQRTQINRRSMSISNPRNKYSPTNQSINQLIDLPMDGWMDGVTHQ